MIDAYEHFMAAADKVGVATHARTDVLAMATMAQEQGAVFGAILIRECSR